MSAVLLTSIGILLVATLASLLLLIRTGERRVLLLTALLALMGGRQGVAFWLGADAPLVPDAAGAAELAALAASAFGLAAVAALARTVAERDRAEALHWDSMEVVRVLGELARKPAPDLDDNLQTLLKMGCERFRLEVGIVARSSGERYEIVAIEAPEEFPLAAGAALRLSDTPFGATVASERPVALEHIEDPQSTTFHFASYLGSAIRVVGAVYGTVGFGSTGVRTARFTGTDKDLLTLMAQWIGAQIERREALYALDEEGSAPAALPPPGAGRRTGTTGGVDLNAAVRRVERRLRNRFGPGLEVDLALSRQRKLARANRGVVEAVVQALLLHARDAMPDGGRIRVETRALDVDGGGEPEVSKRYVTLSVSDTGSRLDAEALSRVFEPSSDPVEADFELEPEGRLALATAYHLIQHDGGDISVDVRNGRGATFTVYLPRAEERAARRRQAASGAPAAEDAGSAQQVEPRGAVDGTARRDPEQKANRGVDVDGLDARDLPVASDA